MANKRLKYEASTCSCGRIHITSMENLDWMQEDYFHRTIFYVCTNCGVSSMLWLEPYEEGFSINSIDINPDDFKPVQYPSSDEHQCRVFFSKGIPVPMMNGKYADMYSLHHFVSTYEMSNGNCDSPVSPRFIVDIDRLIKEVGDEEIIKAIRSRTNIGINWVGTAYEHI